MQIFVALMLALAERSIAFSRGSTVSKLTTNDSLARAYATKHDRPSYEANISGITRPHFIASFCTLVSVPIVANGANLPQNNGADMSRTGSIDALVPIVKMRNGISTAKMLSLDVQSTSLSPQNCRDILKELGKTIPGEEKLFKRIFDEYSTPVSYKQKFLDQNAFLVYYSRGFDGPGRPNIENTGGDIENTIQTIQYGFRNEAWTAIDDLFSELEFGANGDEIGVDTNELSGLIEKALVALDSYLRYAPEADVKEASRWVDNNLVRCK